MDGDGAGEVELEEFVKAVVKSDEDGDDSFLPEGESGLFVIFVFRFGSADDPGWDAEGGADFHS